MSQRRILRGHLRAHSREVEYLRTPLRTRRRQHEQDEEPAQNGHGAGAGNPFGVVPGGTRPGTINTPPPRNAPDAEQTPR